MRKPFKLRPIPADFFDRFPDGDYTVGRGADPRGRAVEAPPKRSAQIATPKKSPGSKRRKKPVRPAAE
jgi:hypothetical protein